LARAEASADIAGENSVAWAKATSSAGIAEPMTELACSTSLRDAWFVARRAGATGLVSSELAGTSRCQRRVRGVPVAGGGATAAELAPAGGSSMGSSGFQVAVNRARLFSISSGSMVAWAALR
jgi:hypothetical protein